MTKSSAEAVIENVESFGESHSLVTGYQGDRFLVAVFRGSRLIKSLTTDDLNALAAYRSLKQWLRDEVA